MRPAPTKPHRGETATLWLLRLSEVAPEMELAAERLLGHAERQRHAGFARPLRRRQFALARLLLRLAASQLSGLAPADISCTAEPGRPPRLSLPAAAAPPGLSLSHSGDWVACALDLHAPLGLDIEAIDRQRDVAALGGWAFSPDEAGWLSRQPDPHAAFYRLWTGKEAWLKLSHARGEPCLLADTRFELDSGEPCCPQASWHTFEAAPGLALSLMGGSATPALTRLAGDDLPRLLDAWT